MKVMSLFAGIGGFDLAAERMGWETSVQVEIDPWCQQVLAKNFPNAFRYGDIKTFDGTPYNGSIDLVCGGFPCQPYSVAGKGEGDQDERHLWPYMFRVIRQVAPRWVVGENVGGFLTWNGGLVFEQVHAELEAEGYEVQSFVLPACGVNAPHKRDRVWIVACRHDRQRQSADQHLRTGRYAAGSGSDATSDATNGHDGRHTPESGSRQVQQSGVGAKSSVMPNADKQYGDGSGLRSGKVSFEQAASLQGRTPTDAVSNGGREGNRIGKPRFAHQDSPSTDWSDWPTQPPVCAGNDGISARLDRARNQHRNRTIKAAGNAVVWQVVYQIFKAIQQVENQLAP